LAALGIRIAGYPEVRKNDVVGKRQIVVAQRLAFSRDPGHDLWLAERTADRQVETYLHTVLQVQPANEP